MKLYEIATEFEALLNFEFDFEDEGEQEAFQELYDKIMDDLNNKSDSIGQVLKTLEAQQESIKIETDRLRKRSKMIEHKMESLKSYIKHNMEKMGKQKIEGNLFTFAIQNNPKSVVIDNELALPKECFVVKTEVVKSEVKKMLEEGKITSGAHFEQSTHLRIR